MASCSPALVQSLLGWNTTEVTAANAADLVLGLVDGVVPDGDLVDIDDVGMATAYLATPYAKKLTGMTFYVDAGLSIMC